MPELPEVETILRELHESQLIGLKIRDVEVFWPRTIATDPSNLPKQLLNQTLLQMSRRGKFLVFTLSKGTLLIHLRMTGKFLLSKQKGPISSHERAQISFTDGRILHYEDQRKFGKWYFLPDPSPIFKKLGLEPLSKQFTLKAFTHLLQSSQQRAKPFLLNQKYIAGLGNIYVDEALWEAKIHPLQKVNQLSPTQLKNLHKAIINVLKQGIHNMGTTLGSSQANYFSVSGRRGGNQSQLKVFRRENSPCPRCHHPLTKIIVAQRGTHICPHCQNVGALPQTPAKGRGPSALLN